VGEVPDDNPFGKWLRAERTDRGLTGEALAFLIGGGMSQGRISSYERGIKKPERDSILQIADALAGPDADEETREALRKEALTASVGIEQIQRLPTDDAEFWDAYEGAPQEDRELAKQLLKRARDRERARTIGGNVAE
jgi:transcriptional regulator with XRE-family HTH domain